MGLFDFLRRNNDNQSVVKSSPKSATDTEEKSTSVLNPMHAKEHSAVRDFMPKPNTASESKDASEEPSAPAEPDSVEPSVAEATPEAPAESRWERFKKGASAVGSTIMDGGRAAGSGLMSALGTAKRGMDFVGSSIASGAGSAAKWIGKKMGIGLTPEEKKTSELQKANPNFSERFGTDKSTKEVMAAAGVGGVVGGAIGGGIGAAVDASRGVNSVDASKAMWNGLGEQKQMGFSGAGSAVGAALGIGLGVKGVIDGSNRLDRAKASGDHAGKSLAIEDIAGNSVGLTKGAISAASTGVKFAGMAGNIGLDAAKGAVAGLGAATGALTIAEGLFKGGIDSKHLHKSRTYVPVSEKGKDWRSHIVKKKAMRVGVNALKVIGGSLAIAGSVLSAGALTGAAMGIGLGMTAVKFGMGIYKKRKMANERKKMFGESASGENKGISEENIKKSNELRSKASVSKTGSIAFEMIEAVKKFDEAKYKEIQATHIVSQKTPTIKDRMADFFTIGGNADAKARMEAVKQSSDKAKEDLPKFGENERETYDAHELLQAIGVSKEEALSASGQELIEKKVSVTNSL